ncbi:MAG: helix-hairpin-helix domain-containing protein, partial [Chloroflexota bacterium]
WNEALRTLTALIDRHHATLIAIGNGTASRETEQLAAELTRERDDVKYLIVNEAGASVYSASELAVAELPDLDVTVRGAVSIARRVQDPLAELVKIDPKSVGVGLYQHDVNQTSLSDAATVVVESVVNNVGVEVNTASPALLSYVAGIGPKLAANIVTHRDQNGPFKSRAALKKVTGLGPKSFEQAAGFLRVRDSRNWLDASAIHPESYPIAKAVMKRAHMEDRMSAEDREVVVNALREEVSVTQLADELDTGVPTLQDILDQLIRPGRDPRADLPDSLLRSDVMTMDDLKPGMLLSGTIRNVVDFGAFIDIGVKQDGLLHISQIPRNESLTVGDVIEVSIRNVDKDRGRIGLGWSS